MDGFKAYKYFMAIKLHFTNEKYDVFEMNGRVSGSREAFERRNDRGLFEKLARKFDKDQELIQFLAANFAYGHKNVVYSSESDEYYHRWLNRKQSRSRQFNTDLMEIVNHLEMNKIPAENLYSVESGMPELLNLYIGDHVSIETMVILQGYEDYLSRWEPLIMLWHDHFLTIRKCTGFVKYDKIKLQSVYINFKEQLSEL
jgi:hypothetical protein